MSHRRPPILIVFVFKSLQHFTKTVLTMDSSFCGGGGGGAHTRRSLVLNSTIDCGGCLLGNRIDLSLLIENTGCTGGRFFLVVEEDWYTGCVNAVNEDLTLNVGAFEMWPVFFQADPGEFVEIRIKFFPSEYGLAVEKLFLLCNNNTLQELEIIGDGLRFEPNTICIQQPTKPLNNNNADASSEYLLDFRKCIRHQKKEGTITVHNNSILELMCEWEMRESVCHVMGTCLLRLNRHCVSVSPTKCSLPGQSTTDFQVKLDCNTDGPGIYSLVLTLYVLDVPETSFAENFTFHIGNETPESDSLSQNVIVGEVEVRCEIVNINVLMDPPNITVPYVMGYDEVFHQKVQIYTSAPTNLDCVWQTSSEFVKIVPAQFTLSPETLYACTVTVSSRSYRDLTSKLTLVINGGLYKKELHVVAMATKPMAEFSETLLNFGCLSKSEKTVSRDLYVRNVGCEPITWEIYEFAFNFDDNELIELNARQHVSVVAGRLDVNEACQVTYVIDNKNEHHFWLSFLILLSSHPIMEAMNSLCLVTYEIAQPQLVLHMASSVQPILYPGKLLYLGLATNYTVCLHNVGLKLPGSFIWGKPVGRHGDSVAIKFEPRGGVVQPQSCTHVKVTLLPLETGVFDEIHVPCFVGNVKDPIIMLVLCVVDDIRVYFHLPGDCQKIFWPPKIVSDFSGYSLDLDLLGIETESYAQSKEDESSSSNDENSLNSSNPNSEPGVLSPDTGIRPKTEIIASDLKLHNIESCNSNLSERVCEETASAQKSSSSASSYVTNSPCKSLKYHFSSDLILQQNVIEVREVPLRTAIRKTVGIENVTPLIGRFKVEATNFYESEVRVDVFEEMLTKFRQKPTDEWEDRINNDLGLIVRPVPAVGTVGPHETVNFDIWIYANTWGVYVEEILIEVNDVVPFCFTILVEVIGIPVEFPFTLHSISNNPTLRYGCVPYQSEPISRTVKIKNNGCVPLCLVWHVFLASSDELDPSEPFNVVMDIVQVPPPTIHCLDCGCDEPTLQLMITPKYYGREDNDQLFQVLPRQIHVHPKNTGVITVTMNPAYFRMRYESTDVRATLIGHVHLAQEHKFCPNLYSRQTGVDVPPVKLGLLASMELPRLTLDLTKGDAQIKVYATEVIESERMRHRLVLLFKNTSNTPASIYVHVSSPFRVVSLRTVETIEKNVTVCACVRAGGCVEVHLECSIDSEEIARYSNMLYNDKTGTALEILNLQDSSVTVVRQLNVHQHGFKYQALPLQLRIIYPELRAVPNLVDFGVVFVGNTGKSLLTLKNCTGAPVRFSVHKSFSSKSVIVRPVDGIVPKAAAGVPSSFLISLYFIPGEARVYSEAIRIFTNVPFYHVTVNITGTGSNNEKFYKEEI